VVISALFSVYFCVFFFSDATYACVCVHRSCNVIQVICDMGHESCMRHDETCAKGVIAQRDTIYIYVYILIYIYVYVHIYIHLTMLKLCYMCVYIYIYVHTHICIYIYILYECVITSHVPNESRLQEICVYI